jgi:hypothetical protein
MDKTFRDLCEEVASGDIGSERFNRLWIETGIPLEGQEFEIANLILAKSPENVQGEYFHNRTLH